MQAATVQSGSPWIMFANDWAPTQSRHELPRQLNLYSAAMEGLLRTQQQVSAVLTASQSLTRAHQFTATFKLPSWNTQHEQLRTTHVAEGIDYVFASSGQTCFKGSLYNILAPDAFGTHKDPLTPIAPSLTTRKLDQFKTLYPHIEHLWIVLTALTTAHFLHSHYTKVPEGAIQPLPQMLGVKVQFDQRVIRSGISQLETEALTYASTSFNIGKYDTITLTIYLARKLLVRTDLCLLNPLAAEDIGG